MTTTETPEPSSTAGADSKAAQASAAEREYDRTGFYPSDGKKFRIWALLGWNIGVIVMFALIAAAINYWALG